MAEAAGIPQDALRAVALQLGGRIRAELAEAASAPRAEAAGAVEGEARFDAPGDAHDLAEASFELGETFEVWKLAAGAVEEFKETGADLSTLARPARAYHHQIKAAASGARKRAVAYAHSWAVGGDAWSVRDLYFAPLAAAIDEAVARADKLIKEDDDVARLLSLPEYKVDALWFVSPPPGRAPRGRRSRPALSRVMVVSAPPSFRGRRMSLINSADFMRALALVRRGGGFIV